MKTVCKTNVVSERELTWKLRETLIVNIKTVTL